MDYIYLIESISDKNITIEDIDTTNDTTLNILCYHITTDSKYPFLQFLIEKIPFCNDLVKEQFIFPYVNLDNLLSSIELLVIHKIQSMLYNIGCNCNRIIEQMYKGIVYDKLDRPYAVVNITGIDISGLQLYRTTSTWFILPSEIINCGEICNISVSDEIMDLFIQLPELGILTNKKTGEKYILPDVVYTGGDHKNVVFNSIFGNNKSKAYSNSGDYYYFYRGFNDVIKEGGWIKNGGNKVINANVNIKSPSNRVMVENEYGRYIKGGINRYALFSEGKICMESNNEFSLSDKEIEALYPEPVIIICYLNSHDINPDILVKEYDNFTSLSWHILDKSLLDEKYISENNKKYMIL
jgi:hypothetical protein